MFFMTLSSLYDTSDLHESLDFFNIFPKNYLYFLHFRVFEHTFLFFQKYILIPQYILISHNSLLIPADGLLSILINMLQIVKAIIEAASGTCQEILTSLKWRNRI